MADPERAWQSSMRHYFQEVDYHGLAQLFRKWNVKGTENKNGTWIDWNQVPENCQKEVKTYVLKVVESRRKQKEWEDYVRRESLEMSHQQMIQQDQQQQKNENLDTIPEGQTVQSTTAQEGSFTFEERDHIVKNENWGKKSFHKRVANPTVDETNPSQWVLDRVPYPLAHQGNANANTSDAEVENRTNDGATAAAMMSRWKKIGNLSHLILRDTHLRWVDEEYDESYFEKDKKWRAQEESWWKDSNGNIKKVQDEEMSQLDTMERQRIQKAHQWMKNRNKFSSQNQKTLRRFRDFLRLQTSRNSILICPATWAKQTNMASQRTPVEYEENNDDDDEVSQQQDEYPPSYQDGTEENDDEESDKPVNPWDRTGEDDEPSVKKKTKKKTASRKKCDTKTKKNEKNGATIFESGMAVQKSRRGRKKN